MSDHRTREEHTADIAAHTLTRLDRMRDEFEKLAHQLRHLGRYAEQHHPDLDHEFMLMMAGAAQTFSCCLPESVRDVASRLPLRGLEF